MALRGAAVPPLFSLDPAILLTALPLSQRVLHTNTPPLAGALWLVPLWLGHIFFVGHSWAAGPSGTSWALTLCPVKQAGPPGTSWTLNLCPPGICRLRQDAAGQGHCQRMPGQLHQVRPLGCDSLWGLCSCCSCSCSSSCCCCGGAPGAETPSTAAAPCLPHCAASRAPSC